MHVKDIAASFIYAVQIFLKSYKLKYWLERV